MNRRAFIFAAGASSVLTASVEAQAPPPAPPMPRFGAAAAYSAARAGTSLLIVRNGVVLAEDYPGGGPDARWPLGAGTRSLTALLAGSLIEDRLLRLDDYAATVLPEWSAHPLKSQISLRALLNGTSGLAFNGARGNLAAALALEPVANLGERFIDDPAPYMLFVEIARRRLVFSGRDPDPARYLTDRTLGPIGSAGLGWSRAADSAPLFDDGAAASARSWAQIGELIRRDGVWRAEQLVDDGACQEALRGTFAQSRAGIGFWLAAPGREQPPFQSDLWRGASPAPIDLAMAAGAGGQRLYIAPSLRLVIVRQSRSRSAAWSDADFLSLALRDLEL